MWLSLYWEANDSQLKNPQPLMQFKLSQRHENMKQKSLQKS